MAALCGPGGLFLACALLSSVLLRAEGDPWGAPCEEQQRYRQNHSEPEVVWGSSVAILGILGALMLVQYVIRFINKDQCPWKRKRCEIQQEVRWMRKGCSKVKVLLIIAGKAKIGLEQIEQQHTQDFGGGGSKGVVTSLDHPSSLFLAQQGEESGCCAVSLPRAKLSVQFRPM